MTMKEWKSSCKKERQRFLSKKIGENDTRHKRLHRYCWDDGCGTWNIPQNILTKKEKLSWYYLGQDQIQSTSNLESLSGKDLSDANLV